MRYSYDAAGRFGWMEDHIHDLLNEFSEDKKSMTNQEAIGILLYIRTLLDDQEDIDEINEALRLAVKALKDNI